MAVKHTSWPEKPKESKKLKEEIIPQVAVVTPSEKKKQQYKKIILHEE